MDNEDIKDELKHLKVSIDELYAITSSLEEDMQQLQIDQQQTFEATLQLNDKINNLKEKLEMKVK